jgi:sarcosine oxidase subunit beta
MGLKNVSLVSGDEIRGQFPQLRGDDIIGGSFCSTDGFVDPYSAMIGYMTWASDRGAVLWKNATVIGISKSNGCFEVTTTRDTVSARAVVNCAGAWSAGIAKMLEIYLPSSL